MTRLTGSTACYAGFIFYISVFTVKGSMESLGVEEVIGYGNKLNVNFYLKIISL